MKLDDSAILNICIQEMQDSATYQTGELSDERADAMDRYLGAPLGNEEEGRSQVVSRDTMETIEWVLPSLMRLMADADNLVHFEAVGPEDEEQAKQESEVVNHIFWQKNRGFYNLYACIKDGLLSKTGVLKAWWDDSRDEEREEYKGIDPIALFELLQDREWSREVIDFEENDDGTLDVTFKAVRERGQVRIEPCPPEEFGVSRSARSPYAKDCPFVYHRTRKTRSQLVEEGYDRKKVDSLPDDSDLDTRERLSRYHLSDEQDYYNAGHKSMALIWVTEAYVRVDRNDDGIAELLKVTFASSGMGGDNGVLLDIEEVDRVPFSTFSPVLLTHKFYGLSLADLVGDLQDIKTALLRGTLDAMYLANNPRTAVNERVNLDDMLTSRPGGLVRTQGTDPPGNHIMPIPQQPVPGETFGLLEYLDTIRQDRTGSGDNVPSLDKNSLANVNPSVAAIAYDAARTKIELLARIIAEICLVPLFRDIHELTAKHSTKAMTIRLRNGWSQTNPQEWRRRENLTVQVGIGLASRERRLMTLEQVYAKQMEIGGNGGMGQLLQPANVYRTLADWTDALGMEPSAYWTDPATIPPAPPQPDPNAQLLQLQAQIEGAKNQTAQAKIQLDARKMQVEAQMKAAEFQLRREELTAERDVKRLQAEIAALKAGSDSQNAQLKAIADAEKNAKESELKQAQMLLQDAREKSKLALEWQKASLASATTLTVEQLRQMGLDGEADKREQDMLAAEESRRREDEDKQSMRETIANLQAALQEISEGRNAPKRIERDEMGRAIAIGGLPIRRNAQDLIESIG